MESIWKQTAQLPGFGPLEGNRKTEVLIIGGGLTGILCAWFLQQAGVDYLLVEAERICGGTTKNTTAKITSQHGLIYDELIRRFGVEQAAGYLKANQDALERYRTLCQGIDCDFAQQEAFVYSLDGREKIERELMALERLGGVSARFVQELPLPFAVDGAVCFEGQAQFHPLKFVSAIAREMNILEHTKVMELQPGQAVTDRGTIRAEKMIAATHFPFLNNYGSYFLKLYQHRSYVLALRGAPRFAGMYLDEAETGLSFRHFGALLLLGGGSHRTGKQGGNWAELEAFAKKAYPGAEVVACWAAQDCMSLDSVPYIGPYSRHTPGLYVASGFNKWGMTSAMTAAYVLSELVQGRPSPYGEVFSPQRTMLRPQLAVNAGNALLHLLKPTVPRCPHMGCALEYNAQEHSWDCPCHGSRFTEAGKLIDNPAMGDKKL